LRQRDEAKEQRILAGTLAVVESHGLAGLSMEAVARAARVATGTVYVYFENKEALLNALYLECKRSFARAVFEGAGVSGPVRPAFERMCIAYMRYIAENRGAVVFMNQFRNSASMFEQTREVSSRSSEPLLLFLERGKSEGLLKEKMPTSLMAAFLQATLAELTAYVADAPPNTREQSYREIARLAWDALKA
jgi:AcrR family transcriptional regulator